VLRIVAHEVGTSSAFSCSFVVFMLVLLLALLALLVAFPRQRCLQDLRLLLTSSAILVVRLAGNNLFTGFATAADPTKVNIMS